jgi:hypothetical protein
MGPELFGAIGLQVDIPISGYDLFLLFCKKIGGYFTYIFYVSEQLVRIGKITVYIVEVIDKHVAPEYKFVEVLGFFRQFRIFGKKGEQQVVTRCFHIIGK